MVSSATNTIPDEVKSNIIKIINDVPSLVNVFNNECKYLNQLIISVLCMIYHIAVHAN